VKPWVLQLLVVGAGGSLGAISRYAVGLLAVRFAGTGYPWGTLVVNLLGCLLIGVALELAGRGPLAAIPARLFFVTGFLGAFTTFSTFAVETIVAGRTSSGVAAANLLAHNAAGLLLALAGIALVRWWP
jgi:CrcB protein